MKKHTKKLAVIAATFIIASITTIVVFAASPATAAAVVESNEVMYGCNVYGQQACYTLMWNEDGTFVDRDTFEQRYDQAVLDGLFSVDDKDYFLEMYDYCADRNLNGCCGRASGSGRGMGCGRMR